MYGRMFSQWFGIYLSISVNFKLWDIPLCVEFSVFVVSLVKIVHLHVVKLDTNAIKGNLNIVLELSFPSSIVSMEIVLELSDLLDLYLSTQQTEIHQVLV